MLFEKVMIILHCMITVGEIGAFFVKILAPSAFSKQRLFRKGEVAKGRDRLIKFILFWL